MSSAPPPTSTYTYNAAYFGNTNAATQSGTNTFTGGNKFTQLVMMPTGIDLGTSGKIDMTGNGPMFRWFGTAGVLGGTQGYSYSNNGTYFNTVGCHSLLCGAVKLYRASANNLEITSRIAYTSGSVIGGASPVATITGAVNVVLTEATLRAFHIIDATAAIQIKLPDTAATVQDGTTVIFYNKSAFYHTFTAFTSPANQGFERGNTSGLATFSVPIAPGETAVFVKSLTSWFRRDNSDANALTYSDIAPNRYLSFSGNLTINLKTLWQNYHCDLTAGNSTVTLPDISSTGNTYGGVRMTFFTNFPSANTITFSCGSALIVGSGFGPATSSPAYTAKGVFSVYGVTTPTTQRWYITSTLT